MSFSAVASAVVSAASIDAAYEVVRDAIRDQLHAESWVVEWTGNRWAVPAPIAIAPAVDEFFTRNGIGDRCADFSVHASGASAITVVPLNEAPDSPAVLVIEGDWTSIRQPLVDGMQLLALALRVVGERTAKLDIADVLVDGYARIRRLSRLGSMEEVAQRVVKDVAAMLGATRVSLALYRPDAGGLTIVATEGFSLALVKSHSHHARRLGDRSRLRLAPAGLRSRCQSAAESCIRTREVSHGVVCGRADARRRGSRRRHHGHGQARRSGVQRAR